MFYVHVVNTINVQDVIFLILRNQIKGYKQENTLPMSPYIDVFHK